MKKIINSLLAPILAVFLICSLCLNAFALETQDDSENEDYILVTREVITNIAVEWAEYIRPDLTFDVSNIYEYYDLYDKFTGYSVSLVSGEIPYGYIILDLFQENIIKEFVIDEGVRNICETALPNDFDVSLMYDTHSNTISTSDVKLHTFLPLVYAISYEFNGEELYSLEGAVLSKEEYRVTSETALDYISFSQSSTNFDNTLDDTIYPDVNNVYLQSIPSGYSPVDTEELLDNACCFSQSEIESLTNSYACDVVAGLNILQQNNLLLDNDIVLTYDWLWRESGTFETEESKANRESGKSTIVYGGTYDGKIIDAVIKVAYIKFAAGSYKKSIIPTYQNFKSAIISKNSAYLASAFKYYKPNEEGQKEVAKFTHAVSVVGYRSDKDSELTIHEYIIVADGWGSFRYIELAAVDFTKTIGWELHFT